MEKIEKGIQRNIQEGLLKSVMGADCSSSPVVWEDTAWKTLGREYLIEAINKLSREQQKELFDPSQFGSKSNNLRDLEVFSPIKDNASSRSLCGMMHALAHVDREYFALQESCDFEHRGKMREYIFKFRGFEILNNTATDAAVERRIVRGIVSTPPHDNRNVFECLEKALASCHVPIEKGLLRFFRLMSRYGWFEKRGYDLHVSANLIKRLASWGGSYRLSQLEQESQGFMLENVVMNVGDWQFIQNPRYYAESPKAMYMASYGYTDQIAISKLGTQRKEQIHLYMDPHGDLPPVYDIFREDDLDGLIGGGTWTEKELRLAEMMGIRDEIFLDKAERFPILSGIRQLTSELLSSVIATRRNGIIQRFGSGTLKIST